jgi:two-component system, response regulator YesN
MQGFNRQQTLLFVEDDRDIALVYTNIFSGTYRVLTSSSGQHAIDTVRQAYDIDLVILDYRLGDMSGLEVLREVKKNLPSVPVLFITAYGNEEVAVQAFRNGARDYIKKPFDCDLLRKKIEFCLSLKQADKTARRSVIAEDHDYSSRIPLHDIASQHRLNIEKALRFIDDNFMTKIKIESTAAKACFSRYHFSRAFKKATNTTYQDYIAGCRVQKAKELLKDPCRTITEIAHHVGYTDINNLVRNFKKLTGQTPTEYREFHLKPGAKSDSLK